MHAVIATCSPAGSTRQVGGLIAKACRDLAVFTTEIDLARKEDQARLVMLLEKGDPGLCLFIGSPVYVNRPLPPVMQAIARLPVASGAAAVPFVTWGCVSSGIALYEMGQGLIDQGLRLVAAVKVPARHSLMWRSEIPLGGEHPDAADRNQIHHLVAAVHARLTSDASTMLELADLAYQPEQMHAAMGQVTLAMIKDRMPPRKIDRERCTTCSICQDNCPMEAISLTPFPEFADHCIFCFNCVRLCPEDAITADLREMETRIRERAKEIAEVAQTTVFL